MIKFTHSAQLTPLPLQHRNFVLAFTRFRRTRQILSWVDFLLQVLQVYGAGPVVDEQTAPWRAYLYAYGETFRGLVDTLGNGGILSSLTTNHMGVFQWW